MSKRLAISILFVVTSLLFYGCAGPTRVAPKSSLDSAVLERSIVTVPYAGSDEEPAGDYEIGPGDLLAVSYDGSLPSYDKGDKPRGYRVDGAGYVTLPLIGRTFVKGMTAEKVRMRVEAAVKRYIKEPAVLVQIEKPVSHPLYLIGAFKTPGVYYMDGPLNLIQGMALGGGPDATGNLRTARVLRGKKLLAVDVYEALMKGDLRQNIWLKSGDTIYLPDAKNQNVFVFGAVKSPGQYPVSGQLTLPQALTLAGFGDLTHSSQIRIIRSDSNLRGELIVVDISKIMKGEAPPFLLADGDVVYVPRSFIGDWNAALTEILPTLQTFAAVLNPFVQLKYLMDIK